MTKCQECGLDLMRFSEEVGKIKGTISKTAYVCSRCEIKYTLDTDVLHIRRVAIHDHRKD